MVSVDEFIERPAWELHNAVVNRRLEARLCLLCNRVDNLVQRVTNRNFRGHLCNRIARRLGRECRGAADTGIDLDDIVFVALRIERILGIAAPFNAELSNDAKARAAEHLILVIRQCLCGSDDNTVTCMNADGIKILHTANGDAVVIAVTDDLELDFLPSGNAALDEYLPNHRVVKPLDDRRNELFLIFCNAAACAAHCIRRTYDDGISDGVCKFDS